MKLAFPFSLILSLFVFVSPTLAYTNLIDYRDFLLFLPRFNPLGDFDLFDYNQLIGLYGQTFASPQ